MGILVQTLCPFPTHPRPYPLFPRPCPIFPKAYGTSSCYINRGKVSCCKQAIAHFFFLEIYRLFGDYTDMQTVYTFSNMSEPIWFTAVVAAVVSQPLNRPFCLVFHHFNP